MSLLFLEKKSLKSIFELMNWYNLDLLNCNGLLIIAKKIFSVNRDLIAFYRFVVDALMLCTLMVYNYSQNIKHYWTGLIYIPNERMTNSIEYFLGIDKSRIQILTSLWSLTQVDWIFCSMVYVLCFRFILTNSYTLLAVYVKVPSIWTDSWLTSIIK